MKASIDGRGRAKVLWLAALLAASLPGCGGKSTAEWVEQLRAADASDRLHAVNALAQRGREADVVVPALAGALRDEDAFVRRDAAEALGKIGPAARAATPGLTAAARDRNAEVRQQAVKALRRIDPDAAGRTPATGARPGG